MTNRQHFIKLATSKFNLFVAQNIELSKDETIKRFNDYFENLINDHRNRHREAFSYFDKCSDKQLNIAMNKVYSQQFEISKGEKYW